MTTALRAWRIPASEAILGPLERLYRSSSLALYVADTDEEPTKAAFDRYE